MGKCTFRGYGPFAYRYCDVWSVVILNSVETIGEGAFKDYTDLDEVVLENGVKNIGSNAFSGCTSLDSITIPESVETIGTGAFNGIDVVYVQSERVENLVKNNAGYTGTVININAPSDEGYNEDYS